MTGKLSFDCSENRPGLETATIAGKRCVVGTLNVERRLPADRTADLNPGNCPQRTLNRHNSKQPFGRPGWHRDETKVDNAINHGVGRNGLVETGKKGGLAEGCGQEGTAREITNERKWSQM